MIADYDKFIAHLKATGRMKLLPAVLRELKEAEAHAKKLSPKRETSKDNPELISGYRELKDGILVDNTGKRALIEIYQRITK